MTKAATIDANNFFVCHFFQSTMIILDNGPTRLHLEARLQDYLDAAEIYYGDLAAYTIIYRGPRGTFQHIVRRLGRIVGLYDLKATEVEEATQEAKRTNVAVIG